MCAGTFSIFNFLNSSSKYIFIVRNGRIVSSTRPAVTVQPRQGVTVPVHSSLEQQTSSGQIFGDRDPVVSKTFTDKRNSDCHSMNFVGFTI